MSTNGTLNKVILIGRVIDKPTPTDYGSSFKLITKEVWKDKDNNEKLHEDIHKIKINIKELSELSFKHLQKDTLVYIEGQLFGSEVEIYHLQMLYNK